MRRRKTLVGVICAGHHPRSTIPRTTEFLLMFENFSRRICRAARLVLFLVQGENHGAYKPFNLETAVGRGGVCGYGGAGQGAARRNGCSIPTSCNAALRRQNRAIRPVATSHQMGGRKIYDEIN